MVDSRDKDIENLRNLLNELKLALSKKEEDYTRKIDHMTITFKQEKEQLNSKLETLQIEFNQLEKDLMNVNHDKQRLSNEFEKTKNTLKDIQDEYAVKKQEYLTAFEQFKRKIS